MIYPPSPCTNGAYTYNREKKWHWVDRHYVWPIITKIYDRPTNVPLTSVSKQMNTHRLPDLPERRVVHKRAREEISTCPSHILSPLKKKDNLRDRLGLSLPSTTNLNFFSWESHNILSKNAARYILRWINQWCFWAGYNAGVQTLPLTVIGLKDSRKPATWWFSTCQLQPDAKVTSNGCYNLGLIGYSYSLISQNGLLRININL